MDHRFKIGIFGSANGDYPQVNYQVDSLVKELVNRNCILITGATDGIPGYAATQAHILQGEIWGFSPSCNEKQHLERTPTENPNKYTKLFYVPENYEFRDDLSVCRKYRNVTSTASCDAGIIISGRWGSLNEFTNLFDMEKVIGILLGSGGIADELPQLCERINKKSKATVVFEKDPHVLVDKIIAVLER